MGQFFTLKAVARYVATVAFSIFSYAVMAQSAPSTESCGHVLSAFQQRLYNHYLAGPDSLRQFVVGLHGVRQLDIHEVDAWARNVQAQVCPADGRVGSMSDDAEPPSTVGTASRVDMPVAMTRAAVRQELALARSAHQLQFGER